MEVKGRRAIAVFAHNEATRITACLRSVHKAVRPGDQCVVLNNGSTDDTQSLVRQFCETNAFCRLVTIDAGDKANAWNVFVHELGIQAELFCFLDGDCEIARHSLDALENCIASHPLANAATALPSERRWQRMRKALLRDGGLAGNLYALSEQFVRRLRSSNVRLPFGLIGDDSLVGALAYWDLDPKGEWDKRKIVVCPDAEFSYASLWPFSLRGLRLNYRRRIRYSLRHFQTILMRKPLKQRGLSAIPASVDDLYAHHFPEVRVKWRGVNTLFDYIAARRIDKRVAHRLGNLS